jgi:quercetin dioxygenase-like cupin family protein
MKYIKKLAEGKILKQAELLPVLENQIVSTKLSDTDTFSIELFSFGKGQSISSGKALGSTLFYVLKGSIKIGEELVSQGEVINKTKGSLIGQIAMEDTLLMNISFLDGSTLRYLPENEVIDLNEFVKMVPLSTTSNSILQNDKFTMTLFALDANEGLSTHAASGDAMVFAIDGEIDIHIDQEAYDINKGDALIMPYGIPHSLKAITPFKFLLLVVSK